MRKYLTEADICETLIKMMEGVESELFTLDYHRLEWHYNYGCNIRVENYLSN